MKRKYKVYHRSLRYKADIQILSVTTLTREANNKQIIYFFI